MRRSFAMVWSCVMIAVLCITAEEAAAQRPRSTPPATPSDGNPNDGDDGNTGQTPTTPPGNGGQTPGNGGQTPGNGGQTPGNGGQTPGNGGQTPGNGGENPGEQPSELTPFEELICQLIAEEIVFGNQDFGLLLYFIFAADDEALADCVIENVFALYLMGNELPMR